MMMKRALQTTDEWYLSLDILQVMSEMSLSRQSLALVLTTQKLHTQHKTNIFTLRDTRKHKRHKNPRSL